MYVGNFTPSISVTKESARSAWKISRASLRFGWPSSTTQPSASNALRGGSSAAVTRRSIGRPPRSRLHATRTPLKSRPSGRRNVSPGSLIAIGERGSGPAIALSNSAASATVRAIGPCTLSEDHAASRGHAGTRPAAVRSPTTLQKAAGLRSEPPVSLPSAIGTMPHASATAAPPLEPPHVFVRSYGLRSEEHTSELQSPCNLVCRLLLEKKKQKSKETQRHEN